MNLHQKTVFITGATRGIGLAIALRCAQDGANIVITGKTAEPHPSLPGTIYDSAKAVRAAGGNALPLQVDVRDDDQVGRAIETAVMTFGGIDILINNASAIFALPTTATPMKRFDLMMDCNARATFLCSQLCHPHLKKSANPHILNLSPPLNLDPKWFVNHLAYTMSKYGMSMCTLGMAQEFAKEGIAVNSLWPKTAIGTSAITVNFPQLLSHSRKPEIVADAAYAILTKSSKEVTGNFFIDEEVLKAEGKSSFDAYAISPEKPLQPDFFL